MSDPLFLVLNVRTTSLHYRFASPLCFKAEGKLELHESHLGGKVDFAEFYNPNLNIMEYIQ